jgi:pimeloyl-ACP methyl ester carboxylesterase
MAPLLARLADDFPTIAPDLPGFGETSDPPEPLRLPGMADALAGWMDAVGMPRAAFVGNSLGCQVIAHLAARHPERLARAVLISPTMDPTAPRARQQIARLLLDVPRERWPLPLIASGDYLEGGVSRGWQTLVSALREPSADSYRRIAVPALVVRGERDPIVSAPWAREVTRLLPQGRLVTVPDAPHAVNFSAPDALAHTLRPFLSGAGAAG